MSGMFGAVGNFGAVPTDPSQYTFKDAAGTTHYCAYLGRPELYDTSWPCRGPADQVAALRSLTGWLSANPGKLSADWMAGQRAGTIPPPAGFPSLAKSNTMLYVGVGLAAVALIGGAVWFTQRQKKKAG